MSNLGIELSFLYLISNTRPLIQYPLNNYFLSTYYKYLPTDLRYIDF